MQKTELCQHLDDAPLLFDIVDDSGTIVYANATQAAALGYDAGWLAGKPASAIYAPNTLRLLARCFEQSVAADDTTHNHASITMLTKENQPLELTGNLNMSSERGHTVVRLAKWHVVASNTLRSENEILASILETARDATYCIEFDEPVDLTAPEHEVIRQVFENACRWRYCNDAMGRFYRLPPDEDMNARDVREVFDRNPDNESFVRKLMASSWHLNGATSRDHRYDGADIFVDNDVRAHISDGRLIRFWGTLRDQSTRILKERQLKSDASQALDLLGAIPDPVLVINADGRIEGANPASERDLGWPMDEMLGIRIDSVVKIDGGMRNLIAQWPQAQHTVRRRAMIIGSDGKRAPAEVSIARMAASNVSGRLVMTVRTADVDRTWTFAVAGGGR